MMSERELERDLASAFTSVFGEVFQLNDPIVKEEKKLYTEEEVEKLLNAQKEKMRTKPRTISTGSVIAARRMLEGFGFKEATISDYYKSETGEAAHIDGGLTSATITITKL